MNVTAEYTKEIAKIDNDIKSLEERKIKLPLASSIIDVNIKKLKIKKEGLTKELNDEIAMTDAYIENVLKRHNSVKFKSN